MKKIFAFLALAILLFGCAQYGAQTNSQSSSQSGGGNKVFIKDFKFGPPEITVKKGDTVKILSGKDRGKAGKVFSVDPKGERIWVEGANMKKKHVRPKRQDKRAK